MVYETKLPRQASTSTVTEDFSDDSEVLSQLQRVKDWEGFSSRLGSDQTRERAMEKRI